MTPEDVEARLANIADTLRDNETAHALEDQLYIDVLRAIAAGEATEPQQMAALALKACELDYARWYA